MAAEESTNAQPQLPVSTSSLPLYPEMILAAIEALNDANGSNKSAISKHIETAYGDLSEAHSTLLSHNLNKMKQSGQLLMVKNNYMKPDPDAPPRRGRGRPPKPKVPLPPGAVVEPPRPRGRPPKPRDPLAPPSPPSPKKNKAPSSGSGRPRGRPPKMVKTDAAASMAPPPSGPPRGRGRPPKVKPVATPVGC